MSDITVIIPAYNAETTIVRAIRSCQDLANCHVLVVDDGSTDSTTSVARNSGAEVIQQSNAGASVARRTGILASDSEFVVLLDADDELIPAGVNRSIELLGANPSASVAGGRVIGVLPNGQSRLLKRSYAEVSTQTLITVGFGPWPPAASVIRRSALESAEQLDTPALSTRFAEDYELVIRLSMVGKIDVHDEPSTLYRLYAGKSSHAPTQALRDKETIRGYYAEVTSTPVALMSDSDLASAAYNRAAKAAWANGQRGRAFRWALRSAGKSPLLLATKLLDRFSRLSKMAR